MELQRLLISLLFTISLFHLCLNPALALRSPTSQPNGDDFIRKCCKATSHPDICNSSLSPYAGEVKNNMANLVRVAISFCLSKVRAMKDYTSEVSRKKLEHNLANTTKQCVENFDDAIYDIYDSLDEMKKNKPDISSLKSLLSSASTNEDTCLDAFEDVPDGPVKKDVINRTWEIGRFTSIALSLVNLYGRGKSM